MDKFTNINDVALHLKIQTEIIKSDDILWLSIAIEG